MKHLAIAAALALLSAPALAAPQSDQPDPAGRGPTQTDSQNNNAGGQMDKTQQAYAAPRETTPDQQKSYPDPNGDDPNRGLSETQTPNNNAGGQMDRNMPPPDGR